MEEKTIETVQRPSKLDQLIYWMFFKRWNTILLNNRKYLASFKVFVDSACKHQGITEQELKDARDFYEIR